MLTNCLSSVTALLLLTGALTAQGELVEYELVIDEQWLAPAGTQREALTVNGGIPGPVLEFTEGDRARITVRNELEDETTSIHWHGLLVPNSMDGVP